MSEFHQGYEDAKRRAATLLSYLDLQGSRGRPVGADRIRPEDIHAAAPALLDPVAVKAVANLAAQTLANLDAISAILAGLCPDDLAWFLANVPGWDDGAAVVNQRPAPRPRARRRPRPLTPNMQASAPANAQLAQPPAAPRPRARRVRNMQATARPDLSAVLDPPADIRQLEPPAPAPEDAP